MRPSSGPSVARLRSASGVQLMSGQGPVHICRMTRRVFSLSALSWARPRCLFGCLLRGPVYFGAGPIYFRVGHAGLPCVFPGSLALFNERTQLFSQAFAVRTIRLSHSIGWLGSSQFQDRAKLIVVADHAGFPRRLFPILGQARVLLGLLLGGPVYFRAGPVYFRVGHSGSSCAFPRQSGPLVKCTQLFS